MNSDNYLHRMTVLAAVGALSTCVTREVVQMSMLPAVVACCKVRSRWSCMLAWNACLFQKLLFQANTAQDA